MADHYLGQPGRSRRGALLSLIAAIIVLLAFSRYIAATIIDYYWWASLGQLDTWYGLLLYRTLPVACVTVIFTACFYIAFRSGARAHAGEPLFGFIKAAWANKLALLLSFLLALFLANVAVDNWTVVRFFGGAMVPSEAGEYFDPVFGKPLHFYFFGLPFYNLLLTLVVIAAVASLLIHGVSLNLRNLSERVTSRMRVPYDFESLPLRPAFDDFFLRGALAILLLGVAGKIFLARYDLLLVDHGPFLVGVNWTADHVVLPLQWLMIAAAILAAVLVLVRRGRLALLLLAIVAIRYIVPPIVSSVYVKPNELAVERPYIQRHINATRAAFHLNQQVKETTLAAAPEIPIDYAKHEALLSNVRLWDWGVFLTTLSQIQPLRPYVYHDADVDRYTIDGHLRQILISARELELSQLGDARNRWINPHLMYTHGYGVVMAEANRITSDGLPQLLVKNAPPEITTPSLHFTTPDLYYAEMSHEPVYVNTRQQEFDYPSGSESVYTRYAGNGGVAVSPLVRLAAAVQYGDPNVLLTSYFQPGTRMLLHTPILDRLSTLAGFISWDSDPYLVLRSNGHLIWMVDGYMTSDAHPYARALSYGGEDVNYMRNSVKATIDAYTGEVQIYIFDASDLLIQAYSKLFPRLFRPLAEMPPDVRAHARYPETLFSAQAEIYRTFHMRDPEAFYNRADLWDLARTSSRRQGETDTGTVAPTYVVASLPNEDTAEFLLLAPFTPANKDNLIGLMLARCDGDHLGELVFEQLSKQNIIYGPMQIDARINQDQTISKDLTLWNQQGSQVIRGQTLVLPIDNSFLYVEPIYIQASQTSMPQLKKVALAMGNRLAYADTYDQALSQLLGQLGSEAPPSQEPQQQTAAAAPQAAAPSADAIKKLDAIRQHLARYRDLSAQGKWAEAGRELDAIQELLR